MDFLSKFEAAEPMVTQSFEQLPEGTYVCQITDIEIKDQTFPEARKISVEFTINDGNLKGRKCWWNTTLKAETTEKAMAFVKGTICKMAGVDSTNGDAFGVLSACRGNLVEIDLGYKPDRKDPNKMWPEIYVNKMIKSDELPF